MMYEVNFEQILTSWFLMGCELGVQGNFPCFLHQETLLDEAGRHLAANLPLSWSLRNSLGQDSVQVMGFLELGVLLVVV